MKRRLLGVAIALACALAASPASARHQEYSSEFYKVTQYCGDRPCGDMSSPISLEHRGRRHAASHTNPHRRLNAERSNAGGSSHIRSAKTGATASISAEYAPRFQSFLDDLETNHGATVYYMGGYRPGECSLRHQHSCNWAVDFCQDGRGVVSVARDCHLPPPAEFHALARAHGLYEGSVWCNGDYGHVQAKDSGGCNITAHGRSGHGRMRLATMTGDVRFVERHHRYRHRVRYARR